MITKISVKLEHCYGIKKLEHTFDFSNNNMPVAIYSPNGMMKTSLARTFEDASTGKIASDRVNPENETVQEILDQDGNPIASENIFVVRSLNEEFQSSKISSLLVSKELKKQYDEIYADIGEKKAALIKTVQKLAGFRKETEEVLTSAWGVRSKDIFTALGRAEREVKRGGLQDLSKIKYNNLFSDRILTFLNTGNFKNIIAEYTDIYEDLIENSTYFKKGIFNHNDANTIAKSLKDNGWFASGHSVNMKSVDATTEILNEADLASVIQDEKDKILTNPELSNSFNKIDDAIKTAELRAFRETLANNKFIIPELADIDEFKRKVWIAYMHEGKSEFETLMKAHDEGATKIQDIIDEAKTEITTWRSVIDIFNERFTVPFIVDMENQDDVILGIEAPQITFKFKALDAEESKSITPKELKNILSNGEKRALYILNIIFEIEARKIDNHETVFLIDDIADSFDYKNKYAIIEYLHDVKEVEYFHQIILTHNFDFYRTVRGRLGIYNPNKLHASRDSDGIKLLKDTYDLSPFVQWRSRLSEPVILIASIPLMRNLAEYTGNTSAFNQLTNALHLKAGNEDTTDTVDMTVSDLQAAYASILHSSVVFELDNPDENLVEFIHHHCTQICLEALEGIELEKKIALSIGIRLKLEAFLIAEINEPMMVAGLTTKQTVKLCKNFKSKFPLQKEVIRICQRVNLMTPENIHLNSFMFEPILDLSNSHLKELYHQVSTLELA